MKREKEKEGKEEGSGRMGRREVESDGTYILV